MFFFYDLIFPITCALSLHQLLRGASLVLHQLNRVKIKIGRLALPVSSGQLTAEELIDVDQQLSRHVRVVLDEVKELKHQGWDGGSWHVPHH